jgi:hypothetical protein
MDHDLQDKKQHHNQRLYQLVCVLLSLACSSVFVKSFVSSVAEDGSEL